jgi:hypothetical protein
MNTVSIIFPARSRLDSTEQLLLSIEKFTKNKEKIDVVGVCDHDDIETINLFQKTALKLSYEFKFISRKQEKSLDLPNHYYSLGLDLSEQSYFKWILGNDCSIDTKNWDLELEKIIYSQKFQSDFLSNKYYYISISDDTHWKQNKRIHEEEIFECCCFPILSSNYCFDLGEFYPREYPTWEGDVKLYKLAKESNKFTILNYREKINILHKSIHNKTMESDSGTKRMASNRNALHRRYCPPDGVSSLLKEIIEKRTKFLEISNSLT